MPKIVLIVDDSVTKRKLLELLLRGEGFELLEAADGAEALEILAREPVDCVITDLLMPVMDGESLCREIRANERFRALPILVNTCSSTSEAGERLVREFGAILCEAEYSRRQELVDAVKGAANPDRT